MIMPAAQNRGMKSVAGLILLSLTLFSCADQESFPTELIGRWESMAPFYIDRFIRISETEIEFGTGGIESTLFFIEAFKSTPQGNSVLWHFECEILPGEAFDIQMVYDPGESTEKLHLKNSPIVKWYKVEE